MTVLRVEYMQTSVRRQRRPRGLRIDSVRFFTARSHSVAKSTRMRWRNHVAARHRHSHVAGCQCAWLWFPSGSVSKLPLRSNLSPTISSHLAWRPITSIGRDLRSGLCKKRPPDHPLSKYASQQQSNVAQRPRTAIFVCGWTNITASGNIVRRPSRDTHVCHQKRSTATTRGCMRLKISCNSRLSSGHLEIG